MCSATTRQKAKATASRLKRDVSSLPRSVPSVLLRRTRARARTLGDPPLPLLLLLERDPPRGGHPSERRRLHVRVGRVAQERARGPCDGRHVDVGVGVGVGVDIRVRGGGGSAGRVVLLEALREEAALEGEERLGRENAAREVVLCARAVPVSLEILLSKKKKRG